MLRLSNVLNSMMRNFNFYLSERSPELPDEMKRSDFRRNNFLTRNFIPQSQIVLGFDLGWRNSKNPFQFGGMFRSKILDIEPLEKHEIRELLLRKKVKKNRFTLDGLKNEMPLFLQINHSKLLNKK